jgi:NTE family protein
MKKIGLALGGGVVLGAAHVGVLRAIEELDIEISHITGTSIGALIGSLYTFGKNCDELQEIASELHWLDIAGISLSRYALLSNKKMGDLILDHIGDKQIEEAKIPLAMIATDASSGEKVILKEGSVAKAVTASTCLPGIFEPIQIKNRMLVDGGVVENVPVRTLSSLGADFTIGVDLNSNRKYEKPKNIVEVILNSFHFIMMQSAELQTKDADILITPNLSDFSRSDISQVESLIEVGYTDAKKALKKLDIT